MDVLFPGWRKIFQVNSLNCIEKTISELKLKYNVLFNGDLEEPINSSEVELYWKEGVQPIFHKKYAVPYCYEEKVKDSIMEAVEKGILKRVEKSDWASPIVVVPKENGQVRICIDPSRTFNKYLQYDHYPLPVIEDLFVKIGGHEFYCLLDLKGAYQQLKVSEKSSEILVITTHVGLFRYTRMPFGIKPAASIFQKFMDTVLESIGYAYSYIDDVIVVADNKEEMKDRLINVLECLLKHNVKVNFEKCKLFVNEVRYLGHVIDRQGLKPSKEKIKAINEFANPQNVTELKSFIGLVNYCSKFLEGLNCKSAILFKLLKKDIPYVWTLEHEKVFKELKSEMIKEPFLVHYDSSKAIVITADACDAGIAGTLAHVIDGFERPVFHVSRTLSEAERKYPILHREALALVFAFEKFYKYIFGRHVNAFTDHQPLLGIYGNNRKHSPVMINRLQRYGVRLGIFDFDLHYRPGKKNVVADFLSRFPLKGETPNKEDIQEAELVELNCINKFDTEVKLDIDLIRDVTRKDPLLKEIMKFVMQGWPTKQLDRKFKQFHRMQEDLTCEKGILVLNGRAVIPEELKRPALQMLHEGHLGIARMKSVARDYLYWTGMSKDIEKLASSCETCKAVNPDTRAKVYEQWPKAMKPLERIHVDFFHFAAKTALIVVDAHSAWLDVKLLGKTDALSTIHALGEILENFGDPHTIVSDNGPPFASADFHKYWENQQVKVLHSPTYHPQSNGLAERGVQEAKRFLKKSMFESDSKFEINNAIREFVRIHNFFPNTQGIVPAHKMLSFKPRTGLEKLKEQFSNLGDRESYLIAGLKNNLVEYKTNEEAYYAVVNDKIVKRIPCVIIEKIGNVMYLIRVADQVKTAHTNQLMKKGNREFVPTGVPDQYAGGENDSGCGTEQDTQGRPKRICKPVERYQSEDFRMKKKFIKS